MKNTAALVLCFAFCGVSGVSVAFADAPQTPSQTVSDFYRWLDRYQNPAAVQPQARQPIQQPAAVSTGSDGDIRQPTSTPAENLAFPLEPPAFVDTSVGVSYEGVGPGEGLGCFYHRSYYSHLPFFKGSAYNLAGSLAVAEPAQVPSSFPAVSPANTAR